MLLSSVSISSQHCCCIVDNKVSPNCAECSGFNKIINRTAHPTQLMTLLNTQKHVLLPILHEEKLKPTFPKRNSVPIWHLLPTRSGGSVKRKSLSYCKSCNGCRSWGISVFFICVNPKNQRYSDNHRKRSIIFASFLDNVIYDDGFSRRNQSYGNE